MAEDKSKLEPERKWVRDYTVFVCIGCKKEFPREPDWLEHIQHCVKHPMYAKELVIAKLQKEIIRLKKENQRLEKEILK